MNLNSTNQYMLIRNKHLHFLYTRSAKCYKRWILIALLFVHECYWKSILRYVNQLNVTLKLKSSNKLDTSDIRLQNLIKICQFHLSQEKGQDINDAKISNGDMSSLQAGIYSTSKVSFDHTKHSRLMNIICPSLIPSYQV